MRNISRENVALYVINLFCTETGYSPCYVGNEIKHSGRLYGLLKNGAAITPKTSDKILSFVATALEKTPDELWEEATLALQQQQEGARNE